VKDIEKNISPLVESLFPDFYREDGQRFVAFVKAYYEWMEDANNTLYHARRLLDYKDVDTTIDDFIVYFKEKYLKNIQLETVSNKRLFVKNALDFYRAKGTERAVDLFFKLVYGEDADIYYPGDDVFKLSNNRWVIPIYIEVNNTEFNDDYAGKQVTGHTSGATAFVDRIVRRTKSFSAFDERGNPIKNSKYIDVFYISNVKGLFQTGEIIKWAGTEDLITAPRMIGSLTEFDVIAGGDGFDIGEEVILISNNGTRGKALVTGTSNSTGIVDFKIIDGGWGYSTNARVIISDKVLTLANVTVNDTGLTERPFLQFETIVQPLANIVFNGLNGAFAQGDIIENYYPNGSPAGVGVVSVLSQNLESANGELYISVLSGNLEYDSTIAKQGNTANATIVTYTDKTATANVMGVSSNVVLYMNEVLNNSFTGGEVVYQTDGILEYANGYVDRVMLNGDTTQLTVSNVTGIFVPGQRVFSKTSLANGNLDSYTIKIGVFDIGNNDFDETNKMFVYGLGSNTYANLSIISQGSLSNFSVLSLENEENNLVNEDLLSSNNSYDVPFMDMIINGSAGTNSGSNAYGFTTNTSANINSIISSALDRVNYSLGSISVIGNINPGANYNEDPFTVVLEPLVYAYHKPDYDIEIDRSTSQLTVGEVILQDNVQVGLVTDIVDESRFLATRLSLYTDILSNTGVPNGVPKTITGIKSGLTANIINIIPQSSESGINANVEANVQVGNGVATSLRVIDSGFGYVNGEIASFKTPDGSKQGSAKILLKNQGFSEGYSQSTDSFLSFDKYLYDGEYYQEYSYEVISKFPFEKYSEVLKKVLHVAGTKPFGTVRILSQANSQIDISSTIEIE
jgi:hypothetical protein